MLILTPNYETLAHQVCKRPDLAAPVKKYNVTDVSHKRVQILPDAHKSYLWPGLAHHSSAKSNYKCNMIKSKINTRCTYLFI